ncbi:MAG: ABC transporter permease [Anaerolineaceae bacterium]|jgi:ABC-2 type transport system permease protein|nr:MAG: ABC transporter permease [Anaerolineaceae bacterium]
MIKTFLIGIKDLKLIFRDRAALILMLVAPFLLTLGMGLVTGRFSGSSNTGIADIPVIIVNLDKEQLGNALADVFTVEELAELVEPTFSEDSEAARIAIDEDTAAAAIIIPEGFTRSVIPQQGTFDEEPEALQIEVYANPARPTGAGIIKSIVDEFISRVEEGRISGQTAIFQMIISGRITPQQGEQAGMDMARRLEDSPTDNTLAIKLNTDTSGGEAVQFDVLAYLAPGMALMFLMFTVSYGGRSILAEKAQGTLPRLLVSPTNSAQILGGKVFGIYLTGVAQMLILIGASSILFQLKWGDPLAVLTLVLAAVFGASGWGMLITALARTPAQVGSVGSAVMLIFGILGGSFISLEQMPPAVQMVSKITPNAWALDGFTTLALGGTLSHLSTPITALLTMGLILFLIAVVLFGKKNLAQK